MLDVVLNTVFSSVCAAAGAFRQRGSTRERLPKDHPASDLWKIPRLASLHQEADQQHFLAVSFTLSFSFLNS